MHTDNSAISLCEESITSIFELCKTIRKKNRKNKKSVEIAKGIAEYLELRGFLQLGQAQWICRNFDYWKMPRPPELRDIELPPKQPVYGAKEEPRMNPLADIKKKLQEIEMLVELASQDHSIMERNFH